MGLAWRGGQRGVKRGAWRGRDTRGHYPKILTQPCRRGLGDGQAAGVLRALNFPEPAPWRDRTPRFYPRPETPSLWALECLEGLGSDSCPEGPWLRYAGPSGSCMEKEMATHASTLAWRIPWTVEPGRLQSTGSQRVGHD